MKENQRIDLGITRGKEIEITIDGQSVRAYEGESIGAVLEAIGMRQVRLAPQHKDPRGLYCSMGICHGCLVTVDGQPNIRACMTPVEPGQNITLQDGFGQFELGDSEVSPGRLVKKDAQIVIVGGGPAGLSAAIAAAKAGAEVLIIDENLQTGGQIYRQLPQSFHVNDAGKLGSDYADGQSLLTDVDVYGDRITIWNDALIWSVFDSQQLAVARQDELVLIDTKAVVVATGAYERPFPVPGWTLPGVMTVGGAQALIKSQRIRPGNRVLLAGSGPLQLVVANQMLDAGMEVVAIAESAPRSLIWQHGMGLLNHPALLKQGLSYLWRLKRANVPLLRSFALHSIHGETYAQRAVLTKVDSGLNPIGSETKTFDVDTVCIGYGLIPNVWMTQMLGCKHGYDPMVGGWRPDFNENMETDQSGVFVAGDGAGIAGVLVARCEGEIAGLYAAAHADVIPKNQVEEKLTETRKKLTSLQKFRYAMDRMYPITSSLYSNITDDTLVCRCEGVTAGTIRQAIKDGTTNLNDIKKRTRAGMGYCQGANCLPSVAAMISREFGVKEADIGVMTTRPPAKPIPLSLLMVDIEGDD